jgi:hypothetical protein
MISQQPSVCGPGGDYVFVGIGLVGPEHRRTAVIGQQSGGIAVRRVVDPDDGPYVSLELRLDVGEIGLSVSPESAVALAQALSAAAKGPLNN